MKLFGSLAIGIVLLNIVIYAGIILGLASVATSGFKSLNHQCGTEYSIEDIVPVAGSLFCPDKEGK